MRGARARINRAPGGCLDLECFRHEARWLPEQQRSEMHLVTAFPHTVAIRSAGLDAHFERGESIWTESSETYRLDELAPLARASGFELAAQWVDGESPFVHALFVADDAPRPAFGRLHAG